MVGGHHLPGSDVSREWLKAAQPGRGLALDGREGQLWQSLEAELLEAELYKSTIHREAAWAFYESKGPDLEEAGLGGRAAADGQEPI